MKRKFRSFEDAKKFVQSLGLKSQTQWKEYRKISRPLDIPSNPNLIYKKQWKGMGDFLGTGTIAPKNMLFRSFKDAKKFVQSLGLKSQTQWHKYCKSGNKPTDIPQKPSRTYSEEWKGFGDWLGTGRVSDQDKQYRPFNDAKKFVSSLNLKSRFEWNTYCKSENKPTDIPSAPWQTYKKQWKGMGDFLGTGTVQTQQREYRSFKEAKKFVIHLKLKNYEEWAKYCKSGKKPEDIPSAPWTVYKEWKNEKEI